MPSRKPGTSEPSPKTKIPVAHPMTRSQKRIQSHHGNTKADEPAIHATLQAHNNEFTDIRGELDAFHVVVSDLKSYIEAQSPMGLLVALAFIMGTNYKQTHVGHPRPFCFQNILENIIDDDVTRDIEPVSNKVGANSTCSLNESNQTSAKQLMFMPSTFQHSATILQTEMDPAITLQTEMGPVTANAPPQHTLTGPLGSQSQVPPNQFWPPGMPPPPPAVCRSWSDITKAAPKTHIYPNEAMRLNTTPRNTDTPMGPYGAAQPRHHQPSFYRRQQQQQEQQEQQQQQQHPQHNAHHQMRSQRPPNYAAPRHNVSINNDVQWHNNNNNNSSSNNNWQMVGRNGRKIHPAAEQQENYTRYPPTPAVAASNRQNHPHQPPAHPKKTPKFNQYLKEVEQLTKRGKQVHLNSKCTINDAAGDLLQAPGIKGQAVGADFAMNAGLAKHTKKRYRLNTWELRNTHPDARPGYIAPIRLEDGSSMLLLVTKPVSTQKMHHDPDGHVQGARDMVCNLAKYTNEHSITELTLPYLCSGLDGLNRLFIRQLFLDAFRHQSITITFLTYKSHGRQSSRHTESTTPTDATPERDNENAESDFRHGPAPVDMNA
jgi:hypothetical protein